MVFDWQYAGSRVSYLWRTPVLISVSILNISHQGIPQFCLLYLCFHPLSHRNPLAFTLARSLSLSLSFIHTLSLPSHTYTHKIGPTCTHTLILSLFSVKKTNARGLICNLSRPPNYFTFWLELVRQTMFQSHARQTWSLEVFLCKSNQNHGGLYNQTAQHLTFLEVVVVVVFVVVVLFLHSQLYLWVSPFWVRFWGMWLFFNPTIKVVKFRLRGWCMLGVFLLPAFTRLGHEC